MVHLINTFLKLDALVSLHPLKRMVRIYIILISLLFSNTLYAATITSTAAGGLWNATGSWVGSVVPISTDDVIIATTGVNAITVNVASTCTGVTINTGASLISTTLALTVNGPWVKNGTYTPGTATVIFGSGLAAVNAGTGTANFNIITIALGTTMTINTPVTVAGTFDYVSATTNSTVTISGSNTLNITGNFSMANPGNNNSATLNVGAGTLTIGGLATLSGNSGTRKTELTLSTGTINMNGGISVTTFALLTFTAGGTLNLPSTVSAAVPVLTPSTGTVNYSQNAAQTVWATTYNNLTLGGSGIKTTTTITVNSIFSLEGTATASAAPTYGASATLRYNRTTAVDAGLEWSSPFAATGGVIVANTGAINPNGNKAFNLDIPLNINSGATLSPAAGNTFSFGGDLINAGTWTASTGDVTITLARASQSIGRFSSSGIVTMSKASGAATFTANINGGAFTMNGAGTLNLGAGFTHTFTGAWTNTTGTLQGNTSTLNIGGTGSGTGVTFTAGTSTVNFNGAGAQNIPTFTYNNLNTSIGGTKTLLGSTIVTNILTVGLSSIFATGAFTLTLSGTGTPLVDNGTFTATAGGTVIYSGATANVAAESYANLQTSTTGVKTLAGNITVSTVLIINIGSTLATGANTLTLTGTGTPLANSGTFTASSGSTVIYSGATATVAGETYVNLQASTAGAKTLGANTTVSEVLTINTGSNLALSTFTLTLPGTGTPLVNSGGTFTASTGTVIFSNATATIAGLTYYNLQTSTSGTKTLAGTTAVTNILTINSPSTLDLSSVTLTLSGAGTPLANSGAFTCSASTVNFSNAGSVNIPALNYNSLNITGGARVLANVGTTGIAAVFNPGAGAFTVAGSTVNFNGAAQTIPAFTFNDLIVSGTLAKTILTATVVNANTIEIQNGPTLDLPGTAQLNITKP